MFRNLCDSLCLRRRLCLPTIASDRYIQRHGVHINAGPRVCLRKSVIGSSRPRVEKRRRGDVGIRGCDRAAHVANCQLYRNLIQPTPLKTVAAGVPKDLILMRTSRRTRTGMMVHRIVLVLIGIGHGSVTSDSARELACVGHVVASQLGVGLGLRHIENSRPRAWGRAEAIERRKILSRKTVRLQPIWSHAGRRHRGEIGHLPWSSGRQRPRG
ncbi:hypothetical protein GGR53DRAFT_502239, partial [Hypoxylon sp. FL1150]